MDQGLEGFLHHLKESEGSEEKLLTKFTIKVKAYDIGDKDYEVEDWIVEEDNYDWEIKDQALYELEYDKSIDLKIKGEDAEWRTLSVEGTYSKDYYGEVDLEIQMEVIDVL